MMNASVLVRMEHAMVGMVCGVRRQALHCEAVAVSAAVLGRSVIGIQT